MGKKYCRDGNELEVKVRGRKLKYVCAKCDQRSPKEKWCCKPREIKR